MAARIDTYEDLRLEKMRVKMLLKEQEDKLVLHYENIAGRIRPFTGLVDAFGAFSGDGEKGGKRSMWMGLVGTVLKIGLPLIISRFFHKQDPEQPKTWWGNMLQTLTTVIDADLIRAVVDKFSGVNHDEREEEEELSEEDIKKT